MISFEYLDRDRIQTFDHKTPAEVITESAYGFYVDEVNKTLRNDIELIPPPYFGVLTTPVQELEDLADAPAILKPYQVKCLTGMVKKRRVMNACLMGMGKTVQAICAMTILNTVKNKGDLVICPGSLRTNWRNEFAKWAPNVQVQLVSNVGNSKEQIQQSLNRVFTFSQGVTIISYELFSKLAGCLKPSQKKKQYFNTIVCDESHFLKDSESRRYRNLYPFLQSAPNLFLMTGTPSPNRPSELYAQLKLLDNKTFSSKRTFTDRYCAGYTDRWGVYCDRGASRMGELAQLLSHYMIRVVHNPENNSPIHVTRTVTEVVCDNNNHDEALRDIFAKMKEKGPTVEVQSEVSQLFRDTAVAKVPHVLELLRDRIAESPDEKVILFCVHMVMFDAVKNFLEENKVSHIGINGGTSVISRDPYIKSFLDPSSGVNIALLTLGTCSTGLNLVPIQKMIFLELQWTPAIIHQAECRINRIGGAPEVYYEYVIARNTLDRYVFDMLFKKNHVVSEIIDSGQDIGTFKFD